MEEYLQIGPHLVDARLACAFQHAPQHGQKPRGHTTQVGDVLPDARLDECGQFLVPVGHECHLFVGYTEEIGQRIDVLDERRAQVTYLHARFGLQLGCKRATQDEPFPREDAALWVQVQIMRYHIACALIVVVLQGLWSDRNELAPPVAGTTGLREVPSAPGP